MNDMKKQDKDTLEYLTKNIPNFQYAKLFALIICKDLNDNIRYNAFNKLSIECNKFIKRNINNENNIIHLQLFQDMIISYISNIIWIFN